MISTRCLRRYDLTAEERGAIAARDIGLLYVLGANGQLLMHYAAFLGMPWADYIAAMRTGVRQIRAGARGPVSHDDGDGREGGGRMSLVFAGIASHAPGITGRAHLVDAGDRAGIPRRLPRHGGALGRGPPRCIDRGRGRAFRQFLHEQYAVLRGGHGGPLRGPDRGSAVAGHTEAQRFPAMRLSPSG